MNHWSGTGRLTREPEIRSSQGENPVTVARFTVACDRRYKKQGEDNADFISCVAFGKTAENIEKYFHKGTKMEIDGRIQTGSYTNKEGKKVYTTDIICESVSFAESKKASAAQEEIPTDDEGFINVEEGMETELPFA